MDRPSPKIHASENPIGLIKKGNNKENWIILGNQIKKWHELGKYKQYYTEHNGSTPYRVIINDKHVYVFLRDEEGDKYSTLVLDTKYDKLFIGKNVAKYSVYKGSYLGSTILIEFKNKYILISNKIYEFETKEPIIKFISIMGNSSVPYPFALTEHYAYCLMHEGGGFKYLERDFGDIDPYIVLYDFKKEWNKKSYNVKVKILNNGLKY